DLDLDLAARALLDTGFQPLEVLVRHVVDGWLRQFHSELLCAGRRHGPGEAHGGADCRQARQGGSHRSSLPLVVACQPLASSVRTPISEMSGMNVISASAIR